MKWSEINEHIEGFKSYYDYVVCDSPVGRIVIEWKSWKESDLYSILLRNDIWIDDEYTLEKAKEKAEKYLENILKELNEFLKNDRNNSAN